MALEPNTVPADRFRRTSRRTKAFANANPTAATRRSLRQRNGQPSPTVPAPAPVHLSAITKRKRLQRDIGQHDIGDRSDEAEHAHPIKRRRTPSEDLLTEKNLQRLNDMNPTANEPPLKRSSSRRSMSDAGTDRTQRSSVATAIYRYKFLAAVKIRIHAEPPEQIFAAINQITNAETPAARRLEVCELAKELRNGCLRNVRSQAGEDDFLDPLHTTLKALGLKNLCTHEKADWRWELKPTVPTQLRFNSSFMSDAAPNMEDAGGPPRKRISTGEAYVSPESSTNPPLACQSLEARPMPPPATLGSYIKTPRPDISIGIQLTALMSALSSQNLNSVEAEGFLAWIQDEMVKHNPTGPHEPMLIPVPALRALDLAFPFAVVEGKAYSTGKQLFEAENQASVSGACGLKIQLDLVDLVTRAKPRSCAPTHSPPLFFTICTEGPVHELWAHWTNIEDGVRIFGSTLIDSCNALLVEQGEGFIVKLNNISLWGVGPFMESVVKRLGIVARMAKVGVS